MSVSINRSKVAKAIKHLVSKGHAVRVYSEEGFECGTKKEEGVNKLVKEIFNLEVSYLTIDKQDNFSFALNPRGVEVYDYQSSNQEYIALFS